jgi:heterotetrameric sarcosine oxidase delta subunit
MLRITCPWCGTRDQLEFTCGGEGHVIRPPDPAAVSDEEWADYLFYRQNPRGVHCERWVHAHGCRQWFNVARDTVTHEILEVYRMGEQPSGPWLETKAQAAPAAPVVQEGEE